MGDAAIRSTTSTCCVRCSGSQDEGVNLAGIKRIIELTNQVEALQARIKELNEELAQLRASQRRDVAVVPKSTALVVWQPRRGR